MSYLSVAWLSFVFALSSPAVKNVEKAFLLNNTDFLEECLSRDGRTLIALPAPLSFSDQLTSQQTVFLFKDIFASFETLEFFPEKSPVVLGSGVGFILKARWSFRDRRTRDLHVLRVFFYFKPAPPAAGRGRPPRTVDPGSLWEIAAVKAVLI